MVQGNDDCTDGKNRSAGIERPGRMLLYPLAEVVIRMFMPVRIGGSQFVMHILRNGERREGEQQAHKPGNDAESDNETLRNVGQFHIHRSTVAIMEGKNLSNDEGDRS